MPNIKDAAQRESFARLQDAQGRLTKQETKEYPFVGLTGAENVSGLKTFTGGVVVAPTAVGDNGVMITLPTGSTGYHELYLDNGIVAEYRIAKHYTTAIATTGGTATVFSIALPANRAVMATIEVVTAHRSAGNVQRLQVFSYKVAIDVFAASISVANQTLIYSHNSSGQPATTVTVGATGMNLTVVLTNNSTTKTITTVTTSAVFVEAYNG